MMDFKVVIEQDEDGWYIVTVPSLPGCVSQGKTEEEAKISIAEAIELHLRALARDDGL
jgi:predicted RNase H-like HicB family nuclease